MLCYWGAQVREGLGLVKPDSVKHENCGINSVCPKSEIQDVSAGGRFLGFVRDGKVSVLRLRGEDNDHDSRLKQLQLKNDKIRSIMCGGGGGGVVLLSHEGKVLIMDQSTTCMPLKGLNNKQVIQITCGDQHSMALTHDGQLFAWGENSHGQLGLGEGPGTLSPQHIQCLNGIPLAQISAGGDHGFALSLSGVVFGWGKNNAGQLGLGDTTDRHEPAAINSLNQKKTVFISCGGEHTATLSKGGTVFTFGSGGFGQLGHNSLRDEHLPRVVSELWGSKVSQIACGRNHTLVLVASSKLIYSFGCGNQRQLGNGKKINQSVPLLVNLPTGFDHQCAVGKLIAGERHSFALFFKALENEPVKPRSNPDRRVLTLDDSMIERWLSECDSESWKTIQKEINTVFSSAASLNGSFLKTSCDGHYQTSEELCGLDFDLVKKTFVKLSESERVISEIVAVLQRTLLPSLNPNPAGVEALRLYLLLPELISVLQTKHNTELTDALLQTQHNNKLTDALLKTHRNTELTEALACKILHLSPDALKVLEKYWSRLPDDSFKSLVALFRKESGALIDRIAFDIINWDILKCLQKFVQILQMLYKAWHSAYNDNAASEFIIPEINDLLDMQRANNQGLWEFDWYVNIKTLLDLKDYYDKTLNRLIRFTCIFNLEAKCSFLKNREWKGVYQLTLRRTALLEDCFCKFRMATEQHLKGQLLVLYTEDMYRSDVNKRDFFLEVFKELRAPDSQFFMYNDNNTMIWFPTKPSVEKERYFLFGILCGLAFHNNCVVHMPFPLALFKKLLNVKPSLEDLKEFSPVLGKSLEYVLDYTDDVEEMDMNFSVIWDKTEVELDPTEPGKIVTNFNRSDFVDRYVDYILNKSMEDIFDEFKRGFFTVCERHLVEMFKPEELRGLLVGSEEYDWDILKQNVTYENVFHAKHPTIISFWKVFDELSSKEKKAFLLFLTGFDQVPLLGMSQVKMKVRNLFNSTEDHLPQALTCHTLLELPIYQTKETLKNKLIEALNHKRGFWEE